MPGSAQPEDRFPPASAADTAADTSEDSGAQNTVAGPNQPAPVGAGSGNSNGNRALNETELDSALQLLVERAQYITGATGTALALPQGAEMVCRASAGSSAPAVGARLQVRSGLTGESIARRQLLRCDNAESDPRVNLEACRALGIASIVVLPLLRRNGEVRGLFELFSDHPYAFEERDLVALERMATLTLTALDLAEQRQNSVPAPKAASKPEPAIPGEAAVVSGAPSASAPPLQIPPEIPPDAPPSVAANTKTASSSGVAGIAGPPVEPAISLPATSVPEAMLRVQKCASCGFPVSEGRTLCLDCEKKDDEDEREKKNFEKKPLAPERSQSEPSEPDSGAALTAAAPNELVPAFLADSAPVKEPWWSNHVNILAIVVLVLGVLVAIVVFR
jgi:hypothetical protein